MHKVNNRPIGENSPNLVTLKKMKEARTFYDTAKV
jgi:hypothetical protein